MKKTIEIVFFLLIFLAISITQVNATTSAVLRTEQETITDQDYRRTITLYNFLDKFNSPLKYDARVFVDEANKYDLDYRLLVAISGVESTFGREIPYNSYNAWGWGIYGNNMIRFGSFSQAIGVISKSLREDYIDRWGAKNVYQIGGFYAASPSWAQRVVYFMERIQPETLPLAL